MIFIKWEDRYCIGHDVVDSQHQRLFELINRLQQDCSGGVGRDDILQAINSLVDYALEHFADEESLMQKIGFEGLDHHRWRHSSFVTKVTDMALDWGEGEDVRAEDILLFLKEWLLDHVLSEDQQIGAVMRARAQTHQ